MRHILISVLIIAAALSAACNRDETTSEVTNDGEGIVILNFNGAQNAQVETRSTLDDYSENRIYNIYIVMFNSSGVKVYSQWFDSSTLTTADIVNNSATTNDCWSVSNTNDSSAQLTTGRIKIRTSAGTGYKIYAIANLDADMVDVSSDRLGNDVQTEADMLAFTATMNQDVISRNGYSPMSGMVDRVDISSNGTISMKDVQLFRMDAKVRFVFKTGSTPDANGQTVKSFKANQWRVVNIPRSTYVMSYAQRGVTASTGADAGTAAANFFSTDFVNFEEFPSNDQSEFSFYMTENCMTPKKTVTDFADRDRQNKDATTGKNLDFEYANELSTYVIVTGRVEMDLQNDSAGQVLGGDVQYVIHLGNFGADFNDFNTLRNTSYTYNVTVNSVNNIRVEVETNTATTTSTENQPGAEGDITIAKEEIALCDAHYVAKTLTFHAKYIDSNLTWRVRTPFCDGNPQIINGVDVPTGLDYKWVHFRLNAKSSNGSYYEERRREYTMTPYDASSTPDGEMDIMQLVKYMKEQKAIFDKGLGGSDFDNGLKTDGTTDPLGPKICVTVHVDEYYYDVHPITGVASDDLWKYFVNQEDRSLHILCDMRQSSDGASLVTGSAVTIQQRAIQSIFNTDPSNTSLTTAWGSEHTDEYSNLWRYNETVGSTGSPNVTNEQRGNTDNFNGRLNSLREWGLCGSSSTSFITGKMWSTYMDVEVENETPQLRDDYRKLRYSCMSRNRDNNGDGKIDQSEMRWYMASIRQLIGIWIGADVIDHDGRLYHRSVEDQNSSDPARWREHVISSTAYGGNSNNPTIVWGEEGSSTGSLEQSWQWGNIEKWSVRCIRNLGTKNEAKAAGETADLSETPTSYIDLTTNSDGSYTFNNVHLNKAALRYYISRELDFDDELSEQNRVYKKFEVAAATSAISTSDGYNTVNNSITGSGNNKYCPSGYRLPNQRELTLMLYYLPSGFFDNTSSYLSRTFFSKGSWGSAKESKLGYAVSNGNAYLMPGTKNDDPKGVARCVKDVRD